MADSPFLDLNRFKAVVLDWDGVIAETRLDFGPVREQFFGGQRVPLLESAGMLPPHQRQAYMEALEEEELRGAALSEPVPGAFELVELLERRGVKWCLLSRNCRSSIDLAARTIGFRLPPQVFSRESQFVKPDPRAMVQAAQALGIEPEQCLAVGDYLFELLGARRCGMRSVLVQRPGPWGELADGVYSTLEDLLRDFESGGRLIPWEYHDLVSRKGVAWLEKSWFQRVLVESLESSQDWTRLLEWAVLGVGSLGPAEDRELDDKEWAAAPGLSPELLRRPLTEVLGAFLKPRYPLISVEAGPWGLDLRSPDPQALLERPQP